MGIEATTSSTSVSSSSAATQAASTASSDNAKKTSTESSFKDEMNKVSKTENKKDENGVEKSDNKVNAVESKIDDKSKNLSGKDTKKNSESQDQNLLNGTVDYSNFASMSVQDANQMLSNDIQQMMLNTQSVSDIQDTSHITKTSGLFSFGNDDSKNAVSLTQSDAQFFINLTQTNDVSTQNVVAQANTMLASGADATEVKQNVQVSQTLLNAINTAKETNQPLRIDFDQNVSVILRVGNDGAVAAHFIPGDKAVEQYLRNNIDNLKATFVENDLPYSDLSYSNSSKQQNERRRQRQQQGE